MSMLELAHAEMGVAEVEGEGFNPRIMEYFRASGGDWVKDDATPWCGGFMGWLAHRSGHRLAPEPLRARSWLDWGEILTKPVPGCVVVLKRGSDPREGHVALLEKVDGDHLYLLGGNQGNKVCIAKFPVSDVLGYRWPDDTPMPAPMAAAVKGSKTLLGALLALLGTVLQGIDQGLSLLLEAAAKLTEWSPVQALAGALVGNVASIGFGLAVFGIVLVITRRLQAAAGGKPA